LPGNQGCSATKIGVGTLLPPHNTPDLGLYVCAGGLDIQNFDKNSRFVVLVISVWEAWTFVWDWLAQGFWRCFRDPNRFPRIEHRIPRISKNDHRVPSIRENRVPRIREIRSLEISTGYITFSLKALDQPTKKLVATGMELSSGTNMFFVEW